MGRPRKKKVLVWNDRNGQDQSFRQTLMVKLEDRQMFQENGVSF